MSSLNIKTKRLDIQLLRGFSVLLVLLYHLEIIGFENGYLGVDIFFVISGFLMAYLYQERPPFEFYYSRIKRLVPSLLFTNFLVVIFAFLIVLPPDLNQIIDQVISSVLLIPNIYFWEQNSYFQKDDFNPLLNLWSLGVEIQYYLFVPLIIFIWKKNKFTIFSFAFISLILCVFFVGLSPKTSFFLMPFRFWEFFIGMFFASMVLNNHRNQSPTSLKIQMQILPLFVVLLLIMFAPVKPNDLNIFFGHPSLFSFILCALVGFILFYGLPEIIYNNFLGKILIKMGDYSYSLYLIHFPVIVLYNYKPFSGTTLGFNNLADLSFILLITIILTYLTHTFVEKKNYLHNNILIKLCLIILFLFTVTMLAKTYNKELHDDDAIIYEAIEDRDQYRCGILYRIFNPLHSVCFLDNFYGSKNILLLGDSHADSIKNSFKSEAIKKDFGILFTSANAPLMGSHFSLLDLMKSLEGKSFDAIVVHYSDIYSDIQKKEKLHKAIQTFMDMNVRVYFIAPIPTYDVHVPKLIYESKETGNRLFLSRTVYENSLTAFRDFVKKIKIESSQIHYPGDFLCNESECLTQDVTGAPLYFDMSHLTISGSKRLNPLYTEIISNINAK